MKMLLDMDTGVDDALALAFALASPGIDLVAVTATFGNVAVEQSAANNQALLALFGRADIPVHVGEGHALTASSFEVLPSTARLHGTNGTADFAIPAAPVSPLSDVSAPQAIVNAVQRYGRELAVVSVGAQTNIARALELDPGIAERLRVVMMGGALTLEGNVSPFAEANIDQDPEAALAVFTAGADVTMVGLDVTMRALTTKAFMGELRETGIAGTFLADMAERYTDVDTAEFEPLLAGRCTLHDPLAVAVAEDPSLVTTIELPLTVDLEGPARGRTVGSIAGVLTDAPSVKVAVGLDAPRFVGRFESRLLAFARGLGA